MYMDFLTDKCDIYHMLSERDAVGYGLPDQQLRGYPDRPDLSDVPCHFNRDRVIEGATDTHPRRLYTARAKLQLPAGTDVRLNDRIVEKATGCEFTAGIPRLVGRGHHIAVEIWRAGTQEAV